MTVQELIGKLSYINGDAPVSLEQGKPLESVKYRVVYEGNDTIRIVEVILG